MNRRSKQWWCTYPIKMVPLTRGVGVIVYSDVSTTISIRFGELSFCKPSLYMDHLVTQRPGMWELSTLQSFTVLLLGFQYLPTLIRWRKMILRYLGGFVSVSTKLFT